jgi:hypothetical protein
MCETVSLTQEACWAERRFAASGEPGIDPARTCVVTGRRRTLWPVQEDMRLTAAVGADREESRGSRRYAL